MFLNVEGVGRILRTAGIESRTISAAEIQLVPVTRLGERDRSVARLKQDTAGSKQRPRRELLITPELYLFEQRAN